MTIDTSVSEIAEFLCFHWVFLRLRLAIRSSSSSEGGCGGSSRHLSALLDLSQERQGI